MSKHWLTWHRWLGLITCIGVFLWAFSGLFHPIMTHLQPSPVAFSAPGQRVDLSSAMSVKQVLNKQNILEIEQLSVITLNEKTYYQVTEKTKQPARYFSVVDGDELENGDQQYAQMLAAHFTGMPPAQIASSRWVYQFDADYHPVNQLLPVWRIEFQTDSHMRAYIDTRSSRLATLVDDTRHQLTQVFRFGHNWSFAESKPVLQVSVMTIVLSAALLSAISGIYLFFRLGRNSNKRLSDKPLRRYHRKLGLLVSLTTLLFASSGMFHLIVSYQHEQSAKPAIASDPVRTASLSEERWQQVTQQSISSLYMLKHDGDASWLAGNADQEMPRAQVAALKHEGHEHHQLQPSAPQFRVIAANYLQNEEASLESLLKTKAAAYATLGQDRIANASWVTKFGGEYGFIFKRLPVLRVQFNAPGNPRYFVEPMTGELAASIHDLDEIEGFSFAYLHKWAYQSLNKDLRDIMVMLFALANIIVAGMGFWLFTRKTPSFH